VGPISAATLGLGGGGGPTRVFTNAAWSTQEEPCIYGAESIPKKGSQIVYYNSEDNTIYTDVEFTTPFLGYSLYWWDQTDNKWWWVNSEGGVIDSGMCGGGDTGLVFALDWWNAEEGSSNACLNGQRAIDKNGSQLLYQNGEMFYVDAEYTTLFNGMDVWWWCQTNNTSYKIATEGNIVINNPCG
jgi:hypothetical protein